MEKPVPRAAGDRGAMVCLIPDVFFSVTVRNAVRNLGHEAVIVPSVAALVAAVERTQAVLAIVDMTAVQDDDGWTAIGAVDAAGVPVLAFGPHRDVDAFRGAKEAGVTRVVANSQFHREMPELVTRYALKSPRAAASDAAE